ncbi:MAG: cobaltochelatase subunit CobN [Pseudomonadota bacterium]
MHLLLAQPGQITDGSEAIDLNQTPADVVIISAADSELAALAEARGSMDSPPDLRLASLMHLMHPMSVDIYLDRTATKSKLVIARVLGGEAYWTYGLEQFAARLDEAGVSFAALPGDDKPDDSLLRASTVDKDDWHALWAYFVEGGPDNMTNCLAYAQAMLGEIDRPATAAPLLRAGLYWPGAGISDIDTIKAAWRDPNAPVVAITFYRALVQGAGLHPVNRLVRNCTAEGLNPLPIFAASLKDPVSAATIAQIFDQAPPAVVINATSFAVSSPQTGFSGTVLDRPGVPVLQAIFSGGTEDAWREGLSGLSARDIAMNVALPEVDGRVLSRAVSFKGEAYFDTPTQCAIATYRAEGSRTAFTARLAAAWVKLGQTANADKKIAIVLANYPNKDGRLANGVGLDTPASVVNILHLLDQAGYTTHGLPEQSADLMARIQAGPTNWLTDRADRAGGTRLSMEAYQSFYKDLTWDVRSDVESRWGKPEDDPFFDPQEGFALSVLSFGNITVGIQPARGYNIDPTETYHAPDLAPPHNYIAFYAWLRAQHRTDAILHFGKHGNLEWLPGKSIALSDTCFPEAILGPTPHLYPFIVNDPGEGTQAKRRTSAVILDHLTPPLTRAETYGPLKDLEALVDEYYEAAGVDPRRLDHLRREIRTLVSAEKLDVDAGITPEMDEETALQHLDTYLCELKESQIRDGLHVFGTSPDGTLERDLAIALARVPRGNGREANASLIRALARDFGIDPEAFDPLDCVLGAPAPVCPVLANFAGASGPGRPRSGGWASEKSNIPPDGARESVAAPYRTNGDAVERLELIAQALLEGIDPPGPASAVVLDQLRTEILPVLQSCGNAETQALLTGLEGRFIAPGPSGAPTRGRPDVLPTGRNFYSVDSRAVPTPTAWTLGWKSAEMLIERHLQDHGDWPRAMLLSAWGTSNMRTGGDDIAQGLALMGVRPTWDQASRRVTGFDIIPLDHLARPRVDVTLRVSGFFRDAFPAQIDLFDAAARAVMALDEPGDQNPAAARWAEEDRTDEAAYRVFGSKPGAYGAGLQAMIDERLWADRADLAEAYLEWGGYAYGKTAKGTRAREALETRLTNTQAVIQNQDNREHDLLDSDDYYQFEGGAAAAVESLSGKAPTIYHNDHSRPERPVIRTLDEEIGRVVRSRVVNPKWIEGVKRHGYKGAFEIAASVDYLFAFAATTGSVKPHHFDLVYDAVIEDLDTRNFIAEANPAALKEIAQRLQEAIERELWQPRSNSAKMALEELR